MKKWLTILFLFFTLCGYAQDLDLSLPSAQHRVYKGMHLEYRPDVGDTIVVIVFNDIFVYAPMKFKNKKQEEFYWRTVRDVKKTLPYAKLIQSTLIESYEYMQTLPNDKAREKYLADMEKYIMKQYKPILKQFTTSQGKMLIKLINRECNQTSFFIVKAFLGSFRANFWQTFGSIFGMNMKNGWNPTQGNDVIIERVCRLVEQGSI